MTSPRCLLRGFWALASLAFLSQFAAGTAFVQTNLVSDIPGLAATTDPDLKNPWGVSFGPTTPFWVSDNGMGLTTLYNGEGTKLPLVVTIPGPGVQMSAPTGQVFNGTTTVFNGDRFIFASEDGLITGWRPALGTTAEVLFDNTGLDAIYKGITIASNGSGTYLYATDFHNGRIDVFPSSGAPALAGNFTDPNLPAGYAPFNIENINGQLYVTYAKQDSDAEDDVPGPGNGFVSVFDTSGNFVRRLASAGNLNSPWGLALAPADWGSFGGHLLIGNFGDGHINAFDLNGNFAGTLMGTDGNPLVNDGLWDLAFGTGAQLTSTDSLYFTAGLNGEQNGLFGRVDPVPEPATFGLAALGVAGLLSRRRRTARG